MTLLLGLAKCLVDQRQISIFSGITYRLLGRIVTFDIIIGDTIKTWPCIGGIV